MADHDPPDFETTCAMSGVVLVPAFVLLAVLTGSARAVPWQAWATAAASFAFSVYLLVRET